MPDSLDWSDRYNTPLSGPEEKQFQGWKQRYAPNDSGADYDLRGAFKAGIVPDAERGHFPDTFKKPNHPTFSDESQYSGKDGYVGGHWGEGNYTPSATNLKLRSSQQLQQYFQKNEPGTKLTMPDPINGTYTPETLPSQEHFDQSHQTFMDRARATFQGGAGGNVPPPAPPGYHDVATTSADGPPPAPAGYVDVANKSQDDGSQPATLGGTAGVMAHQAGSFLKGAVVDTAKGIASTVKEAIPTPDVNGAQAAKSLIDKGDYFGAAKLLASQAVESVPGGKFITGAIHNVLDEGSKAVDAFKKGDVATAANRAGRAIPVVGPMIGGLTDTAEQDPARALGQVTALAAGAKLGEAEPSSVPIVPKVTPKLAPEAARAVSFADKEGIPISAGTRTGDKFVKNVQALAQNQPIASGIASRAQGETRAALGKTGESLASEAHPVTAAPEDAGAGVHQELGKLSKDQQTGSSRAYDQLEQIENDPENIAKLVKKDPATGKFAPNPIASPVDMRSAKAKLAPVLARLEQEMPLAQQQSSRGLLAIRNVLSQDDMVPASVADQNLSALKQLQREAVHPKTQFLANQAVNAVAPLVDQAVAKLGPEATGALNEGRALTKAKYATDATIDQLPLEPVRLFDKLTSQRDTAINLLRDVSSKAPRSLPAVGRAYLEGLFEKATSAEGKPGAGTAYSQWNKLGDSTKQVLFPSPALRGRLDDFFTLAKMVSDNPNPSGTAHLASSLITLSEGGVMLHNPIAGGAMLLAWPAVTKMLYSEGGTKLLMSGLRVPVSNRAVGKVIMGAILREAGGSAKPVSELPSAATAQSQPSEPTATAALQ